MERNSAEENKTLRGELTAEQCAKFTVLESHYKRLERVLGKIPQEELGKLLPNAWDISDHAYMSYNRLLMIGGVYFIEVYFTKIVLLFMSFC